MIKKKSLYVLFTVTMKTIIASLIMVVVVSVVMEIYNHHYFSTFESEVQLPEGGLESLLLDVPPIDTSHLETEYRYDHLGYRYEVFTEEANEWLRAEMTRQADERITPEFEAYVEAIAAEVDAFLARRNSVPLRWLFHRIFANNYY